jgi:hypothetical protein
VGRLGAARVAREPVRLAQGREQVAPAGDDLVGVGLVTGVPQDEVAGRIEHPVEGQRELDHAQIGAEVPARHRHRLDDELTDLLSELFELLGIERRQIGRFVDCLQDHR